MEENPFLRLLAEEAPAEAFEAELRRAAAEGGEAEVARLRADMTLALQVRDTLQERRRREVEFAALNETANDLTQMRDVGRVLQAIVRRARILLGTDTSYLTLIDEERGDTYMRVTEGTTYGPFKDLRLDLGTGLGGLVAQTKRPYATTNYLADERFDHTGVIDETVAAEGLTAILGTPILLGERVIGVLFAANRRERPFAPAEVTLLSSLSAHAAVAIENARLFQEAEQALAELERANAIIRAHSDAVERAAAAHERLTALVLSGGGVAEVAAAVAGLFGGNLVVVDPDGRVIARAGTAEPPEPGVQGSTPPPDNELDEATRAALAVASERGRTHRVSEGSGPGRWVTPVAAGAEQLGALVLCDIAQAPAGADLRTLERAAQVTALLLLNQRSVAEAEQRVRGELLGDLLAAPGRDPDGLRHRARLLSVDLDACHAVVVLADDGPRHRAAAVAAALATERGGLATVHAGDLVLLVSGDDPGDVARSLARRLAARLEGTVTAGAARVTGGPEAISAAFEDARRCLHVLLALGREGEVATAAELGPYGFLLGDAGRDDIDRFVQQALGPLAGYDAERGTGLVDTLAAYFDQGGNLARTARALHVHVNTLYQRLERIARLVGDDWQEPDRALELHLALKLHRLREAR